jgi:hypothetical protein
VILLCFIDVLPEFYFDIPEIYYTLVGFLITECFINAIISKYIQHRHRLLPFCAIKESLPVLF